MCAAWRVALILAVRDSDRRCVAGAGGESRYRDLGDDARHREVNDGLSLGRGRLGGFRRESSEG